jgi:prefoldin subunit 5
VRLSKKDKATTQQAFETAIGVLERRKTELSSTEEPPVLALQALDNAITEYRRLQRLFR